MLCDDSEKTTVQKALPWPSCMICGEEIFLMLYSGSNSRTCTSTPLLYGLPKVHKPDPYQLGQDDRYLAWCTPCMWCWSALNFSPILLHLWLNQNWKCISLTCCGLLGWVVQLKQNVWTHEHLYKEGCTVKRLLCRFHCHHLLIFPCFATVHSMRSSGSPLTMSCMTLVNFHF